MSRWAFASAIAVTSILTLSFMSGAVADDAGGGGETGYRSENACEPRLELSLIGNDKVKVFVGARGLFAGSAEGSVPDADAPSPSPTASPTATEAPSPSPSPSPSVAQTPSPSPSPSASTSVVPEQRLAPAGPKICWSTKVRILAVNADTGKVLFDETDTRTMWFLDTTWVEEFKASKGVIVKVTVTHGKSLTSGSITMPDVPGPVENPTVADVTHNSGTLRWDKPAADGGRAVQHYLVGCGTATPMEVKGTSVALTGLTSDLRYDCTVRAKNEIGPGDAKAISFMTSAAPYAPTPPRAVTVILLPGHQVIGTDWQPPADSGRVPITGYASRIDWTDANGAARSETYEGTMSSVVWKIAPLPGTLYKVVVTAKNQAGLVSEAAVGSLRTPLKPIVRPDTSPSKPVGLEIQAATHNEMAVAWQPPSSDGGKPLTYYLVEWSRAGDETKRSAMLTADELTMTLVGLEPGTRYTVGVVAINKEGVSPAATVVGETKAKPAPEPVKPDAPESVAVLSRSTDFIELTWQPPVKDGGAPVIGYEVTDDAGRVAQVTSTLVFFGGYAADTEHTFVLRAINSVGPGEAVTFTARTAVDPTPAPDVPTAPRDPAVVSTTKSSIALTWREPESDGGSPITGYSVNYGGDVSLETQATSIVLEGLQPATRYPISVAAINDMGPGPIVTIAATTTIDPAPRPAAPSVPRDVQVTGVTSSSIALDWRVPAADGGAPIVGYSVGIAGSTPFVVTETAALISGLTANRVYVLEVQALTTVDVSAVVSVTGRTASVAPAPAPAPTPFSPPKPGGNTDGSLDLDGRAATVRQTSPGKWPKATGLAAGAVLPIETKAGFVTNAGQLAKLGVTYKSPSIRAVDIRLNPKNDTYTMKATLKPGTVSGAVVLSVDAPAITVGGKKYEPLAASNRFIVKRILWQTQ